MSGQFLTTFLYIVMCGLNPFKPVTFVETGWHYFDTLSLPHVHLQRIDAFLLVLCNVIPAEMNPAIVLRFLVLSDTLVSGWKKVVDVGRADIHCVLLVVKWIVRIFWVWMHHRLLQLLQILLISPLLVKLSTIARR